MSQIEKMTIIKISGTLIHDRDPRRKPKEIKFTENDLLNCIITYDDEQTKISLVIEVDGENWQFTQENIQDLQIAHLQHIQETANDG